MSRYESGRSFIARGSDRGGLRRRLERGEDGAREARPRLRLQLELRAPARGERVELRAPVVLRLPPLGRDPPALLEAVQRGVEGTLAHLQHVARGLLDPVGDAVA